MKIGWLTKQTNKHAATPHLLHQHRGSAGAALARPQNQNIFNSEFEMKCRLKAKRIRHRTFVRLISNSYSSFVFSFQIELRFLSAPVCANGTICWAPGLHCFIFGASGPDQTGWMCSCYRYYMELDRIGSFWQVSQDDVAGAGAGL